MSPIVLYSEAGGLGDGDPVTALPGTGKSVPRGLEAVFFYNGLTLNDTSTVDKFRVTQIDGLDDPDVRDSREDNVASHGETAYDSFYGGRTMAITGRIESWTVNKLRDMQQAIRSAFVDLTEHPFYFLTGNPTHDHFINVKKFSKLQWSEQQKDDLFFRDFLITVRASNPRFLAVPQSQAIINFGAGARTADLNNFGNFDAQPQIDIYGPIDAPTLYNSTTDQKLRFRPALVGNTIEVDDFYRITFDGGGIQIIDSSGVNQFSKLAYDSDNIKISPGEINTFETQPGIVGGNTSTGVSTQFVIKYRNTWI